MSDLLDELLEYTPLHLNRWKTPDDYLGPDYFDYFAAPCTVHRDSDVLARANWEAQLKLIPIDGERVMEVCASHWAVGWVFWLAIHKDNAAMLKIADNLAAALEDYPVVDDSLYSQMEWDENEEDWKHLSVKERLAMYRRYGFSGGDLAGLLRAILRGNWSAAYDTLNEAGDVMYRWRN